MPLTVRQVLQDALTDLGVLQEGETASDAQTSLALSRFNRLLDNWNADRLKVYADQYLTFTWVPGTSPTTIGPTGATWTTGQRPVTIEGISYIFPGGGTNAYITLTPRDAQWWHNQITPELATTNPTDFYYNPTWPNGSIYFWPVPQTAYDVELQVRVVLSQFEISDLSDTFTMPPGYRDALTLSLAEELCIPFRVAPSQQLKESATKARARVFANNDVTPRLATQDAGMPAKPLPSFNYLTGSETS